MIGEGGVTADDFANNEEDIAADSENNDNLEDANAEGSNEVYISCIKFISINSITPFLVYSHKFMSIHGKLLLILVGFWIDNEKVQERSYTTNRRRCGVSYHRGVRAWPALCSKKVKDKFVSQCGAIVRDNVPIKYKEWKGKPSNKYMVPDSVKDQLWNDVLKHFALHEGVDANLVKGWTLVKMATQFQNFKKKLTRDLVKNNRTPNWGEYPKIKDHWKSFVQYKKSETFAQKSAQAKNSASKKGEYNHRLGRGGYAVAIPKWRKMEQDLIAKGIISAVFH
jgi:hypothetical protein